MLRSLGSHRPGVWVLQDFCGAFAARDGADRRRAGRGCWAGMQRSSRQGCLRARGVLQSPLERFKWVFRELRSFHPIPALPALPRTPLWCQTVAERSPQTPDLVPGCSEGAENQSLGKKQREEPFPVPGTAPGEK